MPDRALSRRYWDFSPFWDLSLAAARLALAEIVVPAGVAAAAGVALAATIPPHWRAPGMPYLLGYGKNVELTAVVGGLAAGAATQLCIGSRRGLLACALLAAAGLALVPLVSPLAPLVAWWPQLLAVAVLATSLGAGRRARAPAPPRGDLSGLATALIIAALALAVFAFTVGPPLLTIDTYHHGEVLSTAVDLLRGGRPFETLVWPHGLHDTGLAALWILITGKIGTSPVALARATCCGLGAVAVYALARRLLGSRLEAVAVCSVMALAPLLLDQMQDGPGADALYELGELSFVALGFVALTSPRPGPPVGSPGSATGGLRGRIWQGAGRRELLAGLCLGLGHLFRIETAIYGGLAALAVIAWRELVATGEPVAKAAPAAGRRVLWLLAGAAMALAGARLLAGWPGVAWYDFTLRQLPRYHRDALGFALPWPQRGVPTSPLGELWLGRALARMLLVLLLLVQAVREAVIRPGRREPAERRRTAGLIFLAVFAAAAIKSALDRSDVGHVLQWSGLPLLATACLAAAGLRERWSWSRRRSSAVLVLLIPLLDFGNLGFQMPSARGPVAIAAAARERWQGLIEHLSPNPPVGACADRTFTPAESRLAVDRAFIADTCAFEALLRAHGVRRLVIADSAAWYYVRFGLPFPTRFFAMARAYAPPSQLELVDQLRASRPQALLLPEGYGALRDLDVPDALRVPVVDAYLRSRRHGVGVTPTPLGDLFLWDERGACAPASPPAGRADHADAPRLATRSAAYQPASGVLFARGWAIDDTTGRPLAGLALYGIRPGDSGGIEYGLGGNAASAVSAGRAVQRDGWELWLRGWRPHAAREALCVEPGNGEDAASGSTAAAGRRAGASGDPAVSGSAGRPRCVKLDLTDLRVLGPLQGAEWTALGTAVGRAEAMGRADRLRAQDCL
jgi:hypothetical protein